MIKPSFSSDSFTVQYNLNSTHICVTLQYHNHVNTAIDFVESILYVLFSPFELSPYYIVI